jgi:hypothetical protein
MSHAMARPFICLKNATRAGFAVVSVPRNDVHTILAFRSESEALRARCIMSKGVWVLKRRRECEFLSPIPAIDDPSDPSTNVWKTTGAHILHYGIGRFGVDECHVDDDGCIVLVQAFFINRDVPEPEFRRTLQRSMRRSASGTTEHPPGDGYESDCDHGGHVDEGDALGQDEARDGDRHE